MVKMEEISGLEANIGSFQQIFGQIFAFPTTRHQHREHQQKAFVTLNGVWPLNGWGNLGESVKEEQIVKKIYFSDIVE